MNSKPLPVALLFLVWPFGLLYTSLKNFKAPGAKTGFILFCAYFGFVFVVSRDLGGADSARYAQLLRDMHQLTPSFENLWASLYSYETNILDIYQPLLTWLVSLFTDNIHILFASFAFVFGWFYANNIWIVLKQIQNKVTYLTLLLVLVFALIIPIWYINGVRMYTAAQIFIYGILLYFVENEKKKGLLWAGVSIFVHFSFLFPFALLIIYKILPKKVIIYFIFFIITLLFSEINIYNIQAYLRMLPDIFQPRVESYTNIEYVKGIKKSAEYYNWYVAFSGLALKVAISSLLIILIIFSRKFLKKNKQLYEFVGFILFFGSWANIAAVVPSGGRFLVVFNMLSMGFIILYLVKYQVSFPVKIIRLISMPLLIFYCIFTLRVGFDYMGISTFIGNPFSALLIEDNTPLIEFVKSLL
ncbi:MAG: EpsG family protein [Bacteroidales bacterium]|nr:EpsG family protein [Bacteroidales bacterium]